ncbi:anti-sigma factor family protein [Teredinibacter turnerae]|uniref:anti-sigma factor family protein n=1 Tax=Teredinibacter turnerae TaxID=2426 RepID=UPI0003700C18|nr:hypothetical protein [Teredinibacter turnerae]
MTHNSVTDDQIDNYVNGRMSEEDEITFEAHYLENPALLARVESAQALKDGLKLAPAAESQRRPSIAGINSAWLSYILAPQTAIGAIAASLLLIPLILKHDPAVSPEAITTTQFYLVANDVYRNESAAPETHRITLDKRALALGFEVPPALGKPQSWTVSIHDAKGALLYTSEPLAPNLQSVIALTLAPDLLAQNRIYHYSLAPENSQTLLTGEFIIQH